ncbi:MAG: hypothetical protein D6753_04240 [Planctomycetota bacterium]|nr:MAG: hypothetical protein D6753_04240 [Planctomycetota bacterium]
MQVGPEHEMGQPHSTRDSEVAILAGPLPAAGEVGTKDNRRLHARSAAAELPREKDCNRGASSRMAHGGGGIAADRDNSKQTSKLVDADAKTNAKTHLALPSRRVRFVAVLLFFAAWRPSVVAFPLPSHRDQQTAERTQARIAWAIVT